MGCSAESRSERQIPDGRDDKDRGGSSLPLPALLSRVLLAFAVEFERESDLSLAISANVLRILDENGVRLRDLPLLSGVSKEAISMALGIPRKQRAVIEPDPAGSRAKVVRLTSKGREAQNAYRHLLGAIEQRWQMRFGKEAIQTLREHLERLVGEPVAEGPPLFRGLEPYPGGWRASIRRPNTLPHYPMVLHRGGFPDGS
jgi:DNA-binding MarR family transcriptional regulator